MVTVTLIEDKSPTSGSSGSNGSNGLGVILKPQACMEEQEEPEEKKKKPRDSARVGWCFTWNNYPEKVWFQRIQETDLWKNVHKYAMGEEVAPTTGTPHIQGWVKLKDKWRYKQVVESSIHGWHWEAQKKTDAQAGGYCVKGGVGIQTNVKFPRPVVFKCVFDLWWEQMILELIKTEPDDRTIHWFWESEGNVGKSTFCKHLVVDHAASLIPAKSNDAFHCIAKLFEAGEAIDLVVFDIPRTSQEKVNYGAIEQIKNGLVVSGKYEGCQCAFAAPHVIAFANFEPDTRAMSQDRWKIYEIGRGSTWLSQRTPATLSGKTEDESKYDDGWD